MLQEFPENLGATVATPEYGHLFTVRGEGKIQYLPDEQGNILHHTVAQILFMSARASRDVHKSVALIITRLKNRRGRLKKTEVSVEISQGKKGTENHLECWLHVSSEIVGR